jgi:Tfp pilus assembly protein PilF/SAM-dependent methyltransferase
MNRKERRAAGKRGHGGTVSSGPSWSAAIFAQAIRHHQLGQLFDAEAHCRAIVAKDPGHVDSLHLLGMMAQQRGAHDEATAHFRSALRLKPDVAAIHYSAGHSLAELGRIDEAVQAFERARALDFDVRTARPKDQAPDYARTFLTLGNLYMERGRLGEAAMLFERALALKPDFGDAHHNLGALLLAQGKLGEASARFARALELAPELIDIFANVIATLYRLNPALEQAVKRAGGAWPSLPPEQDLLGPAGMAAVAGDALLRHVLELITVRDIGLERLLTALRRALLDRASRPAVADRADADVLRFGCALARQCFINEYVFALAPDEAEQAASLRDATVEGLAAGRDVPALWLAAVASYFPLATLADMQRVLERSWPEPLAELLTQQIREVQQEQRYRDAIPRLTGIDDDTSRKVQQQYEENPYPRWVVAPSADNARTLEQYLRQKFPSAPFRTLSDSGGLDILVAGCGTGQSSIGIARTVRGGRSLAIDLSLSSLSYALRKTRELGLSNVEYAQADILQLGSLGRTFDVIEASGVLHHLADPMTGWQVLLSLLRPHGLMKIGLYGEIGRADVVAARRYIAERGFRPTVEDIRRCRHELLNTPLRTLTKYHDFFSTSECRDLLFHVQEHRLSIPQIREFLAANNLNFIGFELDAGAVQDSANDFPTIRL